MIRQNGGDAVRQCFQCGLCDALCPWNRVRAFSMRRLVREAAFGLTDIGSEEIWLCTTCGICPAECPRDVRQIESGLALRRLASEYGVYPETARSLKGISASLTAEGNPLNEKRSDREIWAEALSVKPFTEDTEYLYFPGCYLSYDPRLKRVARATANILKKAGVNYGILGQKESCCGESIRKSGDEALFKKLARENIKTFIENGVKRIIVSSPHCYHTFKNEYPEFMVNFEIIHITQLIYRLIQEGKLEIKKGYNKRITYHDPCYLGRHNNIYDEPREILKKVPALDLTELPDSHEKSLCCGGGGGRIWMETKKGERFSDIRVKDAIDTGAEILATACPYCITNFEDSRLTLNAEDKIRVMDITEIINELI
ncbi:MAG: (Fe-S)-binding protein [Deltaproteobacteria bacterium]|nr:(Fe-S)-binding protein [Deltaproteobacteria bacterium]